MNTHHRARIIATLLLAVTLVTLGGCATANTIEVARGHSRKKDSGDVVWEWKPKPSYYWFVPLTIPLDIATSPIQLFLIPVWLGNKH